MKLVGGKLGLVLWALLLGITLEAGAFAEAEGRPNAGDEDPFPLRCADFTGTWKSDKGDRYQISQRQCGYLRFQMSFGSDSDTMTVVPDNRTRPGPVRGMQVRHRWNSPSNGTVLETHRTYFQAGYRITEVVMLEKANDNVLLETIYRTVECANAPGQNPQQEYEQNVYRRAQAGGEETDGKVPPRKKPGRR